MCRKDFFIHLSHSPARFINKRLLMACESQTRGNQLSLNSLFTHKVTKDYINDILSHSFSHFQSSDLRFIYKN